MIRVLSGLTTGLICSVCLLTTSLAYGQQYPGMTGANGYMNAGGYAPGQYYSGQPMAQPYRGQLGPQPGVAPAYMASPAQLMQGFGGEQVGPGSFRRQANQRVSSRFAPAPRPQGMNKTPRWFDISVGAVFMSRQGDGVAPKALSTFGVGALNQNGEPVSSIALSADDGSWGDKAGLRFNALIPLSSGSVLEFGYLGLLGHETRKTVDVVSQMDPMNSNQPNPNFGQPALFSVLSGFGNSPWMGFGETDQADVHRFEYESNMDTVELGFRRAWTDPNSSWQGSWVAGVRHFYVTEAFMFHSHSGSSVQGNLQQLDYTADTVNSITGFQLGGDFWFAGENGLEIGLFGKVGVYGNRIKSDSSYLATSINPAHEVDAEKDRTTFGLEAGATVNWRLSQNISLTAGYQVIYLDGVALASDQFANDPPFVQPVPQQKIYDDGQLIYTGFNVGFEWMW